MANGYVKIDVQNMNGATSYTVTDDKGTAPLTIPAVGSYNYGNYANGTVKIKTTNTDNPTCFEERTVTINCP